MRKRILLFVLINLLFPIISVAQRYTERMYEIVGLSEGEEIVDALKIGIPLIVIGFVIAWGFMWRKSNENKEVSNTSTTVGCLGIALIGIGFFALLPLLVWIEFGFSLILEVVIVIAIVCVIFTAIFK